MKKLLLCLLFLSYGMAPSVHGLERFLPIWQDAYPNSNSDDIGCQLCHVNANGNAPWNSYGDAIRDVLSALQVLGGGASIVDLNEAFDAVEGLNIDGDPSGATSLAEIVNHYQPGWAEGAVNTITDLDSNDPPNQIEIFAQLPPTISGLTTQIDPATPVSNTLALAQLGDIALGLETVATGFVGPVMAAQAPGLNDVLFVVEQTGKIWKVNLSGGDRTLFHDVGSDGLNLLVPGSGNDERGLLGLAFDPDYLNNGYFYTYQSEAANLGVSANHQSVVSEWITNNPASDSFSVSSNRRVVLSVEQPQSNHNGGMLNFGADGFLYISLGDGGAADDQGDGHGENGNARDNTNLLGSILRIDPRGISTVGNYGIPSDNPFAGEGDTGRDEIYAYGFRNPYRFTFDRLCFESGQNCNTMIAGDVGQNQVEEINSVVLGSNYGWNWKEGSFFFYPPTPSINGGGRFISLDPPPSLPNNLVDPIAEYRRADGRSVIGGYIYRGTEVPELAGLYVFADFFNGLYYLDQNNNIRRFRINTSTTFIGGFGEDHNSELYVLSRSLGALQKLVPDEVNDDICFPVRAANGSVSVVCL